MCNLYHLAPKDDIELYFRALVWNGYVPKAIGPLGSGLFLRPTAVGLEAVGGQWGMIPRDSATRIPVSKPRGAADKPKRLSTNNARLEGLARSWTFGPAWKGGKRCLVPATWYQEPNWQTKKHIPWQLRRADGLPWALAGLWGEWTDPATGEIVFHYTQITRNCDAHPLLSRLHRPDPKLPPNRQDKRSLVHVPPEQWEQWLHGSEADAMDVLDRLPEPGEFDQADRIRTDEALAAMGLPPTAGGMED